MTAVQTKSVRRREDVRLLTGGGRYAADGKAEGMLVLFLVRSPHAHAHIDRIDVTAARTMPGVVAVYTEADLTDVSPIPGGLGFTRPDGSPSAKTHRKLLAAGRVRACGFLSISADLCSASFSQTRSVSRCQSSGTLA